MSQRSEPMAKSQLKSDSKPFVPSGKSVTPVPSQFESKGQSVSSQHQTEVKQERKDKQETNGNKKEKKKEVKKET